jgi:hypothetical protein
MPETKEQVAKHTPGPWHIRFGGGDSDDGFTIAQKGGPGLIAEYYPPIPDRESMTANAHLIKAAPDLKDGCNALLGLLQLLAARDDVSDDLRKALTSGHRIDEARAAVAKADGH